MYYGGIVGNDFANGEDIGVALFVCGCDLFCNNGECHGDELYDFEGGTPFDESTEEEIFQLFRDNPMYGRLTLTGGNPTSGNNPIVLSSFVDRFKAKFPNVKIWLYSGHYIDELEDMPEAWDLVEKCDVLVDGRWEPDLHSYELNYCGSSNQRLIDIKKTLASGEVVLFMENNN